MERPGTFVRAAPTVWGWPLTRSAQASRNVALPVSPPQLPPQLGPGQHRAGGQAADQQTPAAGLAHGEGAWPTLGAYVHHTTNSQRVRLQTAEVTDTTTAPPPNAPPLPWPLSKPPLVQPCDICEARSPHNKNTLGKCLGSNVCLNWPDESHFDWDCAILLHD